MLQSTLSGHSIAIKTFVWAFDVSDAEEISGCYYICNYAFPFFLFHSHSHSLRYALRLGKWTIFIPLSLMVERLRSSKPELKTFPSLLNKGKILLSSRLSSSLTNPYNFTKGLPFISSRTLAQDQDPVFIPLKGPYLSRASEGKCPYAAMLPIL